MVQTFLEVVAEYDPNRDYGVVIRKKYAKALSIQTNLEGLKSIL
jgi:hypothetical protein